MGKKRDYGGSEDSPDTCFGGPSGTPFCADCFEGQFTAGADVGGNDMEAPCGAAGCACTGKDSECIGPQTAGSVSHRAVCCALCSVTDGCAQVRFLTEI